MLTLSSESYPYINSATLFGLLADQPWSIFLDSGAIDGAPSVSRNADFDVLAMQPICTLVTRGQTTTIDCAGKQILSDQDPLKLLQAQLPEVAPQTQHRYVPGAFGYLGYDLARRFEALPELAEDPENLPLMAMGVYSAVLVVDHAQKSCELVYLHESTSQSLLQQWRDSITQSLIGNQEVSETSQRLHSGELRENMTRAEYCEKFDRVRAYTIAGDCYQVNLAKQFSTAVEGNAWQTYVRLRGLSPAPYAAFCHFPFAQILSNSPESFIQCRGGHVVTSPIKGTAPRDHKDQARDREIAQGLRNSSKDQAENLMIVDLMRNDLSKCCELGSVAVPHLFALHSFANVHHLISTVIGTLRTGLHVLDLLRSCFPGGSITGAPKIRAMEIIEELEPTRRGVYCGAIAYVGADGNLETNIAIRTIAVKDGVARFAAGGGLVIDSDADEEYQELLDKASMMHSSLKN